MFFVTVEKNKQSVPTERQLSDAMTNVGGTVHSVEGSNASRTVHYRGLVNHNRFENELEEIAHGSKTSWNFVWADSVSESRNLDVHHQSLSLFNSLLAATTKSVAIQIDLKDLTLLKDSGYLLCVAKKVGDNAYNVVWQSADNYLAKNTFSWTPQYELFGSNYFEDKVKVDVSTNVETIKLGETSILDKAGVLGPAHGGGPSISITLINDYGPIHPGVNQLLKSSLGPARSTPIYVAEKQVVSGPTELTPKELVLVWFEQNIETSTMFSHSRSKSVEVDLTRRDSETWLYKNGEWVKL